MAVTEENTISDADDVGRADAPICGLVMPISSLDGCSEAHWAEVKAILDDAATSAGFRSRLVSNADDAGVIHQRIVQNLYQDAMVVCDVSGKNPNVMFELGMRLAFDRPTIVVKDDATSYSFDTSPLEHIEYPRGLRFSNIVSFKQKLREKIKATAESANQPGYRSFLSHFGPLKAVEMKEETLPAQDYIIGELRRISERLDVMQSQSKVQRQFFASSSTKRSSLFDMQHFSPDAKKRLISELAKAAPLAGMSLIEDVNGETAAVQFTVVDGVMEKRLQNIYATFSAQEPFPPSALGD